MSLLSRELRRGLKALEKAGESCFVWNKDSYPIVPGSAVRGKDLGAGGFKLRSDLKFTVRLEVLPEPGPQLKQTITYLGDRYRIDTIEKLPGELRWFECNDPDQGA